MESTFSLANANGKDDFQGGGFQSLHVQFWKAARLKKTSKESVRTDNRRKCMKETIFYWRTFTREIRTRMRSHCGDPLLRLPQTRLPLSFLPQDCSCPGFQHRHGRRIHKLRWESWGLPCLALGVLFVLSLLVSVHSSWELSPPHHVPRPKKSLSHTSGLVEIRSQGWWDILQPAASSPTYLQLASSTSLPRFPSSQETERYKAPATVSRSSRTT